MKGFIQSFKYIVAGSTKNNFLSAVVFSAHLPCKSFSYMNPVSAGFVLENGTLDTFGYSFGLGLSSHPLDAIFVQQLFSSRNKKYMNVRYRDISDVVLIYDSEMFDYADFSKDFVANSAGSLGFVSGLAVMSDILIGNTDDAEFDQVFLNYFFRHFPVTTGRLLP